MTKHQTCRKCGSQFVGPDCNIGSNRCEECGPGADEWRDAWDALREAIRHDRWGTEGPSEASKWALEYLDGFDPRR